MFQAKQIMEFCLYPCFGGKRGLGLVRENKWGREKLLNKKPILIAQIETVVGVKNLPNIKDMFDYYMVGPYDLTASLGCPGDFEHEAYFYTLEEIHKHVLKEKRAIHIPSDVKNQIKKYDGYGIVALGMDTTMILESCSKVENL